MTKSPPSLALDMSQEGITLHQLAFDGHWHELARVSLSDAALRERLSNMRDIAVKLEGRQFRCQIWLPEQQIISKNLSLAGKDESALTKAARVEIAAQFGGKESEYTVQSGDANTDGTQAVAAVRVRTLVEAKAFAKSHGFRAKGYSTQAPIQGFSTPPKFDIPVDKVKAGVLGLVSASTAALVLGGGYAFYSIDPLNMWELPPKAADFAPFQQPNPGIERAGAPPLPLPLAGQPVFSPIEDLVTLSARQPLPYLPPRQLTAEALDFIDQLDPIAAGSAPTTSFAAMTTTVNWPASLLPLPETSAADLPPELGLINAMSRVADMSAPELEQPPTVPLSAVTAFNGSARPMTVANTAFFLEPLPAVATRLSPDALAEFMSRSGLSLDQLSRMASPLLLIESRVIEVIPGLPPILPRLRSGQPIPEQVERPEDPQVALPPAPPEPEAPAPLFTVVEGRPELMPAMRPVPPVVVPPAEILPFSIINGAPEIRPPLRPEPEQAALPETPETELATVDPEALIEEPVTAAEPTEDLTDAPVTIAEAPVVDPASGEDSIALSSAVDAAILAALPPQEAPLFALVSGQPERLPRLRSGAEIPPLIPTNAAGEEISAETAAANAMRPQRRPQAIIDLPAPIDPMISGAAPATAQRASHRSADFAANAARIAETVSARPRATAPPVPTDPQTVNLPSSASVARAATIENAINLRQTNLLGIFGTADARTALIMLSGGRMVRVQQGQSFSGWTVVAIGENTVRIKKRNREEILRMPAE